MAIQFLRGTKSKVQASNKVLADGQPLYEKDTHKLKVGDGSTAAKSLPYIKVDTDSSLSSTSTNPIENKAVNTALSGKANSSHTHNASDITSGVIPLDRGGTGSNVSLRDAPNGAIIRKLKDDKDNELWYTPTKNGALYATSENGIPVFGTLPIAQGGTGATTAADARNNLGAFSKSGGTLTGNVTLSKDSNPFFKLQIGNNTETGIVQVYIPKGSSTQKMAVGFGSGKSIIVDDDGCLILTDAMYGTTLPAAGKKGRIFFKQV